MFRQEAAFLRGNDTIEIYDISNQQFTFITKYEILNGKVLEMRSLRLKIWKKDKDILLLYMPKDKVNYSYFEIYRLLPLSLTRKQGSSKLSQCTTLKINLSYKTRAKFFRWGASSDHFPLNYQLYLGTSVMIALGFQWNLIMAYFLKGDKMK